MTDLENKLKPYSKAIVGLLKGTIESNNKVWKDILRYQTDIQEYVNIIGLELFVRENEGYAFLKQFENSEEETQGLVSRIQIGFEASIVLVVVREMLEEFDANPAESQNMEKYVSHAEIREAVELFLPQKHNQVRLLKELDNYINKLNELGYLQKASQNQEELTYRIHRIIKDKVSIDTIQEFKIKLESYVKSI